MRRLVLVRHSLPEVRRDVPAREWPLSEAGKARARGFASRLDPGSAQRVFTSGEPKAIDTARALAEVWALPVEERPGLHEHERPEAQMLTREAFEARVRDLFARPSELVFGSETADQARRRYTMAVMRLVASTSADVVVVSHGTVMALFVAETAGVNPFGFWQRLEMPSAVTLSLPDLRVESTTVLEGQAPRG